MDPQRRRSRFLLAVSVAATLIGIVLPVAPHALAAPQDQRITANERLQGPQLNAPDLKITLETTRCDLTTRDVVARVRNVGSLASQSFTVNLDAGWQQRQHAGSSLGVGREVSFPAITVNYHIDLIGRIGPGANNTSVIGLNTISMAIDHNSANDSVTNTAQTSGCPFPDLTIKMWDSMKDGDWYVLAQVKNNGAAAAPASTLRHQVVSQNVVLSQVDMTVPGLDPGDSWWAPAVRCGNPTTASVYEIDPADQVVESNESNNVDGRGC